MVSYKKQEGHFEEMRKYKKMMNQNSQELVNYKQEMEIKETDPTEMVRLFYDMLLMKNLESIRTKEKLTEETEIKSEAESENRKLKKTVDELRKTAKENNEKRLL